MRGKGVVGWITVSKTDYLANFQQRSFLATFTMDIFLIRCSLWDIHIFQITGSDGVIFLNNWWDFDFFGETLISLEPLIILSIGTPHFNQKTQLMLFLANFISPELLIYDVVRPLSLIRKPKLWGQLYWSTALWGLELAENVYFLFTMAIATKFRIC